jgi:hypothetical protein
MSVNLVGHSAATTRSDHETRNIGTGSGACPHRQLCIRAIQRRLGGRRFGNGWCGSERHDIRIFRDRHDGQCNGHEPRQRHVQQRRQRRGRRQQRTKPVGKYADQPLAQRFNPDACTWRPITSGRQQKAPLWRGFFIRFVAGATSSLPATSCISRHRASPTGRALRAPLRWRRAQRSKDRESASSPPRFRRRLSPRH